MAYTTLLANDVLRRVERLRLVPRRRFTNKHQGANLSGRGGSSTEFSDYRDYAAGDDLRFVDWNAYARLRRPYLKLFRLEEEMNVVVLVDASRSMAFEGKLDLAKSLAAAFGLVGLMQGERVSGWSFTAADRKPMRFPASRGAPARRDMLRFFESIEPGGDCPLEIGVESVLARHKGRGVAIILSDFFTDADLRRTFNALFACGLEVMAIQILGAGEMEPDLGRDVRLVDAETDATLDVSAVPTLLDIYRRTRDSHSANVETMLAGRGGRFVRVVADEAVESIMLKSLVRRGWVR